MHAHDDLNHRMAKLEECPQVQKILVKAVHKLPLEAQQESI